MRIRDFFGDSLRIPLIFGSVLTAVSGSAFGGDAEWISRALSMGDPRFEASMTEGGFPSRERVRASAYSLVSSAPASPSGASDARILPGRGVRVTEKSIFRAELLRALPPARQTWIDFFFPPLSLSDPNASRGDYFENYRLAVASVLYRMHDQLGENAKIPRTTIFFRGTRQASHPINLALRDLSEGSSLYRKYDDCLFNAFGPDVILNLFTCIPKSGRYVGEFSISLEER